MTDYLSFVNSRDIREHLRELDYHMSGEQKLYLINNCLHISLEEKIKALEGLLEEPDEIAYLRNIDDYYHQYGLDEQCSLHFLTSGIIAKYRKLVSLLEEDTPHCCYVVSIIHAYDLKKPRLEEVWAENYAQARAFAQSELQKAQAEAEEDEDFSEDERVLAVKIIKRRFYDQTAEERYTRNPGVEATYDSQLTLLRIDDNDILPEREWCFDTDVLCIYLPMPFQKGDLLIRTGEHSNTLGRSLVPARAGSGNSPGSTLLLFESASPSEQINPCLDASDITIGCTCLAGLPDEAPYFEIETHCYDLEYCRRPLAPEEELLRVIGLYLKGECHLEEVMQFQQYLSHLLVTRQNTRYCHSYALSYLVSEPEARLKEELEPPEYLGTGKLYHERVRIWLDKGDAAPDGYVHCHSAEEVMATVKKYEHYGVLIAELNLPCCEDEQISQAAGPDQGMGMWPGAETDTAANSEVNAQSSGAAEQETCEILAWLEERETAYPVVLRRENKTAG
ncbi:MAG: hypothetical protein IJ228_03915 [Succinivibrio sp.]|nr:hypothetical protein [Succinivibrio sp.]